MVATNWDKAMRNASQPEISYDNNAAWLALAVTNDTVTAYTTEEAEAMTANCSNITK